MFFFLLSLFSPKIVDDMLKLGWAKLKFSSVKFVDEVNV